MGFFEFILNFFVHALVACYFSPDTCTLIFHGHSTRFRFRWLPHFIALHMKGVRYIGTKGLVPSVTFL